MPPPEEGEQLYLEYVKAVEEYGVKVATGVFGAHMQVELVNDGPVTIWLDSGSWRDPGESGRHPRRTGVGRRAWVFDSGYVEAPGKGGYHRYKAT